ncbi:MAG: iron-containing alcohol dehydrogenase [Lachnospiraceae bacterium]|nr:iron-containing alcohol dehydrogenase [Lachnospiraceae bacterium]
MNSFTYYTPTKVIFGKDAESHLGEMLQEFGATKVLIHYGGSSAERSGLLGRVRDTLKEVNIPYTELGGVVPNPRLSKVKEGIELCKKEGVDFLLAVGGGSVIDSCKAIGYGMCYDGDVWDFYSKKAVPKASMPVGCVLTIAAAGSEMSDSSVITNEEGWLKRGCNNNACRCKFAICNPELTYSLPPYQTASGCVDIMMHTMERFFTEGESMEMSDAIALGLIKTVARNAKILMKDPENYDARAEVMWASSLSHNGLTGCGNIANGDWACHQMEHELGGMFDCTHGAGLAAIWGSWARYVMPENPARFAKFAREVFGVSVLGDDVATATQGIEAMEKLYKKLDMPVSIKELGYELTDQQIEELAFKCTFEGKRTIGGFKKLDGKDIKAILKMARG